MLTFVNDGHPDNAEPGSSIPRHGDIYLIDATPRKKSIVTDNLMEGYLSPGAYEDAYNIAFVMNTHADVSRNVIKGFVIGVMTYDDDTPYPNSKGLRVASNVIVTRDTTDSLPFGVAGVRTWAPDQFITDNTIFIPLSKKVVGVVVYGDGSQIENNKVIAMRIERHDYSSANRSVGFAVGNTARNTVFKNNSTYGFDVGLGCNPYQSVPHRVISHHSYNDTLGIDPRGVIAEQVIFRAMKKIV